MGLYWRARQNAERILVKRNDVRFADLPPAFDGFTILPACGHERDCHAASDRTRWRHAIRSMRPDRRLSRKTFGPLEATLDGLAEVRAQVHGSVYGVLGNRDSIRMVPAMEAMGANHTAVGEADHALSLRVIRDGASTSAGQSTTKRSPLTISFRPRSRPPSASPGSGAIPPTQIPQQPQAALHEKPCATQTAADWRSRAAELSPTPVAEQNGTPRRSEALMRPASDAAGPCQQLPDG